MVVVDAALSAVTGVSDMRDSLQGSNIRSTLFSFINDCTRPRHRLARPRPGSAGAGWTAAGAPDRGRPGGDLGRADRGDDPHACAIRHAPYRVGPRPSHPRDRRRSRSKGRGGWRTISPSCGGHDGDRSSATPFHCRVSRTRRSRRLPTSPRRPRSTYWQHENFRHVGIPLRNGSAPRDWPGT